MFGFGGVFGRKPRRFDYRPRYYDVEQEAREQRRRQVLGADYAEKYKSDEQKEADKKEYRPGAYIRNSMMERRGIERSPVNNRARVRRLVVIMAILVLAAVWLLTTDRLDIFFDRWLTR